MGHEAVGRIVGHCESKQLDLRELSLADLRGFHSSFPGSGAELLDLDRSLEARSLPGGTARAVVKAALEAAGAELATLRAELESEEAET